MYTHERTQSTVACARLKIVGIPGGEVSYVTSAVHEAAHGESAPLLREIAQMDDPQARFQIMRLSAVRRLNFHLRALPPALTKAVATDYDSLVE